MRNQLSGLTRGSSGCCRSRTGPTSARLEDGDGLLLVGGRHMRVVLDGLNAAVRELRVRSTGRRRHIGRFAATRCRDDEEHQARAPRARFSWMEFLSGWN